MAVYSLYTAEQKDQLSFEFGTFPPETGIPVIFRDGNFCRKPEIPLYV